MINGQNNGQNLPIFQAIETTCNYEVNYAVKAYTTLKVVKHVDYVESGIKQDNVYFVIYNADKNKYLTYTNGANEATGQMKYNDTDFKFEKDDRNEATLFKTSTTIENGVEWKGYFQIEGLPAGNYYIGEVHNGNPEYVNSSIISARLDERLDGGNSYVPQEIDDNDIKVGDDNVTRFKTQTPRIQTVKVNLQAGKEYDLRICDSNSPTDSLNINITKTKKDGKTKLGGAEFKIKVYESDGTTVKGWLGKKNGDYVYQDVSFDDAIIYNTADDVSDLESVEYANEEGIIRIRGLDKSYKYKIYEVATANERTYPLNRQISYGMTVKVGGNRINGVKYLTSETGRLPIKAPAIQCATVSAADGVNVNVSVTNVTQGTPVHNTITGIVWIDSKTGKGDGTTDYNYQYDKIDNENEKLVQNVKVSLLRKKDNLRYRDAKYTSEKGRYTFTVDENLDLSKYYVHFNYSNAYYYYNDKSDNNKRKKQYVSQYMMADYGIGGNNASRCIDNKSKSSEAWSYKGTDEDEEKDKGLTTHSQHMNLGLIAIDNSSQTVRKDVAYVKAKFTNPNMANDKEYTYYYGKDNEGVDGFSVLKTGDENNNVTMYRRPLYASDLAYTTASINGVSNYSQGIGLKVSITYSITIANRSMIYSGGYNWTKKKDNKGEKNTKSLNQSQRNHETSMTVESVVDTYDKDMYKCVSTDNLNWNINEENGTAEYKDKGFTLATQAQADSRNGNARTLYITFELTENAMKKVLNDGEFTGKNRVDVSVKHNRERYESYEEDVPDGNGGTKKVTYYHWVDDSKTPEVGPRWAPGINFEINPNDRSINGIVFKDKDKDVSDGEVIGDGIYEGSKDGTVGKVKVDLLEKVGGNLQNATRYVYDNTSHATSATSNSITTNNADKKGYYEFTGIVPGQYYIRYTYGDGTQKIYDTGGHEVVSNVISYDYKSTIVPDGKVKDNLKGITSDNYWYRRNTPNSSVAVDDLERRKVVNGHKEPQSPESAIVDLESRKKYPMEAKTPMLEFSVENEETTEWKYSTNRTIPSYKVENINFGIIETPKIRLGFEKNITNVKITNSQGNIIVDGNPNGSHMRYVSNLDDRKSHIVDGTNYVKIEIKDEELYGSVLEMTYTLTLKNDSDVNFYEKKHGNTNSQYEGYYYKFGIKDTSDSMEENITIYQVIDYLDQNMTYLDSDNYVDNSNTETIEEVLGYDYERNRTSDYKYNSHELILKNKESDNDSNPPNWSTYYSNDAETYWKPIYSVRGTKNDTQDSATIRATRTLSGQDQDMEFNNMAKVSKLYVTDEPELIEDINVYGYELTDNAKHIQYEDYFVYEQEDTEHNIYQFKNSGRENTITITPPTGIDWYSPVTYAVIGIIALITISGGIIIIKKKVLRK
ncbi:MAG: hypothetical protein HFJ17_03440 [Clostridia bacterium]|nr:hypothetical protein [Clostridia bacterium]